MTFLLYPLCLWRGTSRLDTRLKTLSPELMEGEFVFVTVAGSRYGACAEFEPVAAITEKEGLTLVIPRAKADEFQLGYETTFKCISLSVDEGTAGLSLTAACSAKLGEHGVNASLMSGSFHQHIFVPIELVDNAMLAFSEVRLS